MQKFAGAVGFAQFFQKIRVTEQFRHLGQQFQVIFCATFWHRHCEEQIYRFAVNRVERNGFFQANECSLDVLAALDSAMWNSDTIAKPGAAQALPRTQALKNFSLAQIITVAGYFLADGFQQSFFAAAVNIAANSFRTKQVT